MGTTNNKGEIPVEHTKDTVLNSILAEKLIVIARKVPDDKLIDVAEALYAGGIRLLEVTYCDDGSITNEAVAASIGRLAKHFEGRMFIGAGTVMTVEQVRLTKEVGGTFIISPNMDPEVIGETVKLGMVSLPGAFTPTEVAAARKAGADIVKLFPADCVGPAYLKAIKAPLSGVRMVAVGGIDENNMGAYLKAGACGFGVGSNILKKAMIDAGDYAAITALAEKYIEALKA